MKIPILNKTTLVNSLVSLMCIGCGFKPVNEPLLLTASRSPEIYPVNSSHKGDTIRILCWNIHKENDHPNFRSALDDLLNPGEPMTRKNPCYKAPDIVLLQEVFMPSLCQAPETETGSHFGDLMKTSYNLDWVFAPNLMKNNTYGGVLTASTLRSSDSRALISENLEYVTQTPKASVITLYDLDRGGARLMVVNVHGINFKLGLSEFKRQLHRVAEFIQHHDGPVVLAGDFNTWRFKRFEILDTLAMDMGFEKVIFPAREQTRSFLGWGYPMDHIYFSKDSLAVVAGSALALDHVDASDHTPLWVELKLL